jgi:hypothetical protein
MNINTIAENLRNTIKGKEAYLARLGSTRDMNEGAAMATEAVRAMLELNINELKVILFDVEKACEQWNLMSWEINPERMGQ